MRIASCILAGLALSAWGCGPGACGSAGSDKAEKLLRQLDGECCEFHTDPTDALPDNSCKAQTLGGSMTSRLFQHEASCVMWAAECLGQMEVPAAAVTPALIAAVRHGPNNYDTGDGVLPIRDRIVLALGKAGDERAVEPLLEALENPRAVDVGPGAIGYASKEPRGEAVALEALGLLGPTARPAVDRILPYLMRPLEDQRDQRVMCAAAEALGRIQDSGTIPALMEALSDPRRAPCAAKALGQFGAAAEVAAPALVRLIEAAPDGDGNYVIRRAISEIRGKQAYQSLPKNYDGMTTSIMRRIMALAKQRKVKIQRMHIDGPHDELAPELASGETVHVEFDRAVWKKRREVRGRVRVTREQTELSVVAYSGMEQLERELARVLDATGRGWR